MNAAAQSDQGGSAPIPDRHHEKHLAALDDVPTRSLVPVANRPLAKS